MVAPAFGFSVGDFIAAIELVGKVAKALRETDGASTRYQQAAAEIDRLHLVLRKVQDLKPSGENSDIIDKIHLCSLACHVPLSRFINKAKKFEGCLGYHGDQMGSKNSIKKRLEKSGRKLQTIDLLLQVEALERSAESQKTQRGIEADAKILIDSVAELKTLVSERMTPMAQTALPQLHVDQYKSLLTDGQGHLVIQSSIDGLQSRFVAQEEMLKCIMAQLPSAPASGSYVALVKSGQHQRMTDGALHHLENSDEDVASRMYPILLSIRAGLTEAILMLPCLLPAVQNFLRTLTTFARSPSLLLEDNIHLEDALGRVMSLPYEHFRYWPVLEARLREAFAGLPGDHKVRQNQFQIIDERTSRNGVIMELTPNSWSSRVFPGSKLAMSMLVHDDPNFAIRACPRCGFLDETLQRTSWVFCSACRLQFTVHNPTTKHRALNDSAPANDDNADVIEDVSSDQEDAEGPEAYRESEMQYFKRVHMKPSPKRMEEYLVTGLPNRLRQHRARNHFHARLILEKQGEMRQIEDDLRRLSDEEDAVAANNVQAENDQSAEGEVSNRQRGKSLFRRRRDSKQRHERERIFRNTEKVYKEYAQLMITINEYQKEYQKSMTETS